MEKLARQDLYSLEGYAEVRPRFREKVLEHKTRRKVPVGPSATLYFEDRLTMQYQIQEMLRIERIFDAQDIQGELDTYNPLIPDGANWKATFMIELPDEEERKRALARLIGIERTVWVRVGELEKVYAIADEDLERETEEKTSSVHFLRFGLSPNMVAAAKEGAPVGVGIDHKSYSYRVDALPGRVRDSLVADLD